MAAANSRSVTPKQPALSPRCGDGKGRCMRPAPAGGALHRLPNQFLTKVVHLLTALPTEVIHSCGVRVGNIIQVSVNRQRGRPDPEVVSELHACKLLTLWKTAVENLPSVLRPGGSRERCPGGRPP